MKQEKPTTYEVIVYDMYRSPDDDAKSYVGGFATLELAKEYARRRTRDSVEELRAQSSGPENLHDRWYMFGEDCCLVQGDYSGETELDFFIAHPATAEERDWASLDPVRRKG